MLLQKQKFSFRKFANKKSGSLRSVERGLPQEIKMAGKHGYPTKGFFPAV
jgi:hypothetical protein